MSQFPPPGPDPSQPGPYLPYSLPPGMEGPRGPRPTSVTVLSIVGILWGLLAVLAYLWGVAAMLLPITEPVTEKVKASAGMHAWTLGFNGVGLFFAFVLIAGTIGALLLQPWGRITMLVWAATNVVFRVLGTIFTVVWLSPLLADSVKHNPAFQTDNAPPLEWVLNVVRGASACFGLVLLIFPVCILVFFNRAKVRAAFAGSAAPQNMPPLSPYTPPNFG